MNKYIVYYFGLLTSIGFIAHSFFKTRARIEINNYNKDQIIGEWILFSLVILAFCGLVYVLHFYIENILGQDDE
jgi:hypothetical protein